MKHNGDPLIPWQYHRLLLDEVDEVEDLCTAASMYREAHSNGWVIDAVVCEVDAVLLMLMYYSEHE